MADLQKDPEEYIKLFKAWSAQGRDQLQTFLRTQLEEQQAKEKILQEELQAAMREATQAELLRRSESLKSALLDAVRDLRAEIVRSA